MGYGGKHTKSKQANRLSVGLFAINNVQMSALTLLYIFLLRHVGVLLDGNGTVDDRLKRDETLAARETQRLKLVVDDIHHVMVVARINLDKQVVIACRNVAFHHLWNLLQGLHHAVEVLGILQIQADVGTCFVSNLFWIDEKL